MLMHFTYLALANSWQLYHQDGNERGTLRKGIMQARCDTDVEPVQVENAHLWQQGKKTSG